MTRIASVLTALALGALVGCNTSPTGGGGSAGQKRSASFKISAPVTSTDLKQGETQTVKIDVDKGSDFKEDVALAVEAPKGITVEPSSKTVKAGEKGDDIEFKVTAAKDAPLGDHNVKVTGTPKTGTPTSVEFKVTVKESKP